MISSSCKTADNSAHHRYFDEDITGYSMPGRSTLIYVNSIVQSEDVRKPGPGK